MTEKRFKREQTKKREKKVSFSRQEFVSALKVILAATDKVADVLCGTDSFIFSPNYVRTYNNQMAFSFPIAVGLNCTVKAVEMLKVLENK